MRPTHATKREWRQTSEGGAELDLLHSCTDSGSFGTFDRLVGDRPAPSHRRFTSQVAGIESVVIGKAYREELDDLALAI